MLEHEANDDGQRKNLAAVSNPNYRWVFYSIVRWNDSVESQKLFNSKLQPDVRNYSEEIV